jgi:hypothetical protein
MFERKLKKELLKYTFAEKIVFYFSVLVALSIIFLSQILYKTSFGKATLAYGLTSLAMIVMLRVLKTWGPKS